MKQKLSDKMIQPDIFLIEPLKEIKFIGEFSEALRSSLKVVNHTRKNATYKVIK